MNKFTLKFTDFQMENSYWNFRETIQTKPRAYFKYLLMILLLLNILDNALNHCWLKLIVSSVGLLILILSFYFQHQTLILIALLFYNIQYPIEQIINDEEENATFQNNYFVCLGTLGVLYSLSFVQRVIAINFIFIIQIVSITFSGLIQWRTYTNMVVSTIVILYFFFLQERELRISFLTMNNKNLIEEILYKSVEMKSYIVHYDFRINNFHLVLQNQAGSITESQKHDFINLSRNMKVMLANQKNIGFKNLNLIKKLSLEQFIIYLFAKKFYKEPSAVTEQINDETNHQLIGVNGLDVHHIHIIRAFDVQPCLIILIKENKKSTQNKSLKYRLKIANKLLDQIETNIEYKLRTCLICLKQMIKQNQPNKKINLARFINAQITQTYNDLNNIKDFSSINQEFSQIRHSTFSLVKCLEDCVQIVKINVFQLYKVNIQIISTLKDDTIHSDQRKIKQLIFNCLFFLVEKSTNITITLHEENEPQLNQRFIKFEIQYQGPIFTINKINNLPIINPQSLEELKHNCIKQLDLELPIALMIVRQLGPYNQMEFKQNTFTKGNAFKFYIFKKIESFHLAPIVSLRPSQNLITNSNFFQKRSYSYKAAQLLTTQEPQLETFRKISAQMISKY